MPSNNLRLLALDGGGVRGLSALLILERLMKTVDSETPPKPCDYFDMIGGTSTGGLIAVMLGRLRMSVKDCIAAYLSLSERVFRKPRSGFTILGKVRSRFDSEELARAVKKVISAQGLAEDSLLKDSDAACKVFVCATAMEAVGTVCFTSYRTPGGNDDLLECTKIWEACLATSAAPSFFDPVVIGPYRETYLDGAMGANNPVRKVLDQAQLMWGAGPQGERVKCLVSIGTGLPPLKSFDDNVFHIGKTIFAMATETQRTAEDFGHEHQSLGARQWYYRFNVLRGLEGIGLEEAAKVNMMAAATRKYLDSEEVQRQIQACMQTSPLQVIAGMTSELL
ncbi:hypothetical protein J4E80_008057 [Alternaria sp. BMP 0032]|nr:hypothetical protein J4E80_008057 [Alternaria sp. BMP 0032]